MVSWVVKVLDTTVTRVVAGCVLRPMPAPGRSPSRRRWRRSGAAIFFGSKGFSASHTRRGPWSEPPMPIWPWVLLRGPVTPAISPERTPSAKARMRALTSSISAETGSPLAQKSAPRAARRAGWSTARSSELLIAAPENRSARFCSTPASRASTTPATKPAIDQGCLERSSVMPAASTVRPSSRPASASNNDRIERFWAAAASASRTRQASAVSGIGTPGVVDALATPLAWRSFRTIADIYAFLPAARMAWATAPGVRSWGRTAGAPPPAP